MAGKISLETSNALNLMRNGMTLTQAAKGANCPRSTLYRAARMTGIFTPTPGMGRPRKQPIANG